MTLDHQCVSLQATTLVREVHDSRARIQSTAEVRDDGAGFDASTAPAGAGIVNLRDRLAAVDGELVTDSSPGEGPCLIVTIPLEAER